MEIGAFGLLLLISLGILFVEGTKVGQKLFDKLCKFLGLDIEPNWEDE